MTLTKTSIYRIEKGYNMYYAIIGDMVHSKKIGDRNKTQNMLNNLLDHINQEFHDQIASNFIITLGDEFQGLLSSAENILHIIDFIQFNLYPVRFRFGIGIGTIDTEINKNMAIGSDGPAYHYARNMVEEIKLLEKGKMYGSTNILFQSKENHDIISLVNSNLQLCSFLERNWTVKQRQLLFEMMLKNQNQKEAAEKLGIVQSSVQRRLKAAGYYDYLYARTTITTILAKMVYQR